MFRFQLFHPIHSIPAVQLRGALSQNRLWRLLRSLLSCEPIA